MRHNEDIPVKLPKSFLKDKTVLYIDSSIGTLHTYIEEAGDDISVRFRNIGFTFLFLPDLADRLVPSLMGYMFPGRKDSLFVEDMYQRIRDLAGLDFTTGFLYKLNGDTFFHAIPEAPETKIKAEIQDLIGFLEDTTAPKTHYCGKAKSLDSCYDYKEEAYLGAPEACEPTGAGIRFSVSRKEDTPDPKTQKIIAAWERIEKEFGITIEDLDIILGYRVKLSRMKITPAGKIILTDWGDGAEVKMDDLTKALYFFYLRHPEGAALKELPDFEQEILQCYMSVTGRDDMQEIEKSVHNFLDPYGNSMNVSISRIKKAFKDIVGDRIAKFYYVDGHYAGTRRIALDRDYVLWEH